MSTKIPEQVKKPSLTWEQIEAKYPTTSVTVFENGVIRVNRVKGIGTNLPEGEIVSRETITTLTNKALNR